MSPTFKQHRKWVEYDSIQKAKWKATHKGKKDVSVRNRTPHDLVFRDVKKINYKSFIDSTGKVVIATLGKK
jgi:hypothetical protein